ncbi:PQQ-binding-like beta-propeller repeat protein [Emcibacter sp. SYSU 3D8]|uniref:outer membrane protein assembly factor BamB family protein n=1 Tax=Emcibacter sp. SYSU 3D8 TaxID=3133969 RepID=UPI0031FF29F0
MGSANRLEENGEDEMKLNGILAGIALAGATMVALAAGALAAMDTPAPSEQEQAAPAVAAGGKTSADQAYRSGGDFAELDPAQAGKGGEVYDSLCGTCHEKGLNRAPQRAMLSLMTPESIYRALTSGVMKEQAEAAELTDDDMKAVAEFLAKRKLGGKDIVAPPLMCAAGTSAFDASEPPVFDYWGFDARNSHFIDTKTAGIDRGNVGKLKLKWSLAFPNAMRSRSQPALAAGAIFVGSHDGTVFALDRETGCARWTFHAGAEVRTGIVVAPWTKGDETADPLMYFGDLIGNVYAIKARTGEQVWRIRPGDHPNLTITAAPVLYKDKLLVPISSLEEARIDPKYECCTFRGSLVALDPASGAEIWRTWMAPEPEQRGVNAAGAKQFGPSGVALWNTPAIDEKRNRVIIATGDNYSSPGTEMSDAIVAMDLDTGKIVWHHQVLEDDVWNGACEAVDKTNCPEEDGPDFDFGAGPVLATVDGKDYVLAGQKSSIMYGFDAEDGTLVWKNKVGRGGVVAGIHFGIAASGDTVFAPVSDVPDGNRYPEGDHPRPGMYALDIKTGEYKWQAPSEDICGGKQFCHPGYSGAITATEDLVLAGANDGYIRIYDAATGKVLWAFDTVTDFTTVNGTVARGGSMGGGTAPIAHDGLLIMNSGYGFAGKMPGNVLLVFEVE